LAKRTVIQSKNSDCFY